MTTGIHFEHDVLRIAAASGGEMALSREEITVVSVYAVDTMVDGICRFVTVDHESGEFLDLSERLEGFSLLVAQLPSFLGFDPALLGSALARVGPDDDDVVVFERRP